MSIFINDKCYDLQDHKDTMLWELVDVSSDIKKYVFKFIERFQESVEDLFIKYGEVIPKIEFPTNKELREVFIDHPLEKKIGRLFDEANEWAKTYNLIKNCNVNLEDLDKKYLKDKELMMFAADKSDYLVDNIDRSLLNDREFILFLINLEYDLSDHLNDEFRDDKEIILRIINKDVYFDLSCISERLWEDRDIAVEIMKIYPYYIDKINPIFSNDEEILKLSEN